LDDVSGVAEVEERAGRSRRKSRYEIVKGTHREECNCPL